LEEGIGGIGPDEPFATVVVGGNKCSDVVREIGDAMMDPAPDPLFGMQSDQALDLVQPGCACRGEAR